MGQYDDDCVDVQHYPVAPSASEIRAKASTLELPQSHSQARNSEQIAGRSGFPNSSHNPCSSRCGHRSPAILPRPKPGIMLDMLIAMQQAPHPGRQSTLHPRLGGFPALVVVNRNVVFPMPVFVLVHGFTPIGLCVARAHHQYVWPE